MSSSGVSAGTLTVLEMAASTYGATAATMCRWSCALICNAETKASGSDRVPTSNAASTAAGSGCIERHTR